MEGLIMTAQILLSLSILVGLHELGHLVAAKAFGMRVEQYSIGFPPKIYGVKYGETEYSIGAIPLGGYVKISGMIDESFDTNHLKEEPKDYEFRSKPAWQRLIVMMGGITVNVFLGIFISIGIVWYYGDTFISKEDANKYGIVALEIGRELGFETGDKIVKINGEDYQSFGDIQSPNVLLSNGGYYTVERDGQLVNIPIPIDFIEKLSDRKAAQQFIEIRYPWRIASIPEDSDALTSGLRPGDKIIEMAGESTLYRDQFESIKDQHVGEDVPVVVERAGDLFNLTVKINEEGTIGFYTEAIIDFSHKNYSFFESVPEGTGRAFMAVWVNIKALGKIFRGEVSASKSISGPIGIAQIFGGTWDWARFWSITGLLSMVLAFMNFLPIPALDGGHVMFLSYEIISGRKPSDKFLEGAQKIGVVFLLALMAFIIFNDIFKLEAIKGLFGG
jgi:regulator of sigma E protease